MSPECGQDWSKRDPWELCDPSAGQRPLPASRGHEARSRVSISSNGPAAVQVPACCFSSSVCGHLSHRKPTRGCALTCDPFCSPAAVHPGARFLSPSPGAFGGLMGARLSGTTTVAGASRERLPKCRQQCPRRPPGGARARADLRDRPPAWTRSWSVFR